MLLQHGNKLANIILVSEKGEKIDDMYETFGVRTFKMMGSHFYLNNKKTVPRGTHNAISYLRDSEICPSDENIVKEKEMPKRTVAITRMSSSCNLYVMCNH